MLILFPAPQTKSSLVGGTPFDLDDLSFPELASTRSDIGGALGAADRGRAGEPAAPAHELYGGALFDSFGFDTLDAAARRRARRWVVIVSGRWGALRLDDRVPPYRVDMCARFPRLGHAPQAWQPSLAVALPPAAGRRGLVVDTRVAGYAVAWRPKGPLADRTVVLKPVSDLRTGKGTASYPAKQVRGVVARRIVQDDLDPDRPEELAEALAPHFDVELRIGAGTGNTHELRVVA